MNVFRVHADDAGETHVSRVDLPMRSLDDGAGERYAIDIPVTRLTLVEWIDPKPDTDVCSAPGRQLAFILNGCLEVVTTSGERQQFQSGSYVIISDDVVGKGHIRRQVGSDPLVVMEIDVADGWTWPVAGDPVA